MSNIQYDEQAIRDHILVLIGADDVPAIGKTLFMYQMFLIFKEVSLEVYPPFFPYQLGPYSNAVAHECNWLKDNDIIKVSKKGRRWIFELTDKGRTLVGFISAYKKGRISHIKKTAHDVGLKGMTKMVKSKYPEYFVNARV